MSTEHDLQTACAILEVDERDLALDVVAHDAARKGDDLIRRQQFFACGGQRSGVVGEREAVRIGIDPHFAQPGQFFQPRFDLIVGFHEIFGKLETGTAG